MSRCANRTCLVVTSYPQLGPQWTETTTTSPARLTRDTSAVTAAAVRSDRSGSSAMPGRSTVAAQAAGTPLDDVPKASTTTLPPAAGRMAGPIGPGRPAPATALLA